MDTEQQMTAEGAIRVVARAVIVEAVEARYGEMWEMYPDVGEHEWQRVCEEVERILRDNIATPGDEFTTAYAVLAGRAIG